MASRPRCSTSVPSISIAFNLRLSDVAEVRRGYEDPRLADALYGPFADGDTPEILADALGDAPKHFP